MCCVPRRACAPRRAKAKNNSRRARKEDGEIRAGEVEKERKPKRRSAVRAQQMQKQRRSKRTSSKFESAVVPQQAFITRDSWDLFPHPLGLVCGSRTGASGTGKSRQNGEEDEGSQAGRLGEEGGVQGGVAER